MQPVWENQRGNAQVAGRFVQAPETQREESHWDYGIVRSSGKPEEVHRNDVPHLNRVSNKNAAAADRLLVDVLYGFSVVRPDHGALINISSTMMAEAEAGYSADEYGQPYAQQVASSPPPPPAHSSHSKK